MTSSPSLRDLVERWSTAKAAERANAQSYLIELCHALGVEPPRPAGSGYEFEYPMRVGNRDGTESINFVDLYKHGHFALEAKDQVEGKDPDRLLRAAFGQVRSYAIQVPDERPPYVMVLDVGKTMLVWDRWGGDYGGFSAAKHIDLRKIHEDRESADLLRDIWTNPAARDPRSTAIAVTKEIAAKLADLARELEAQGHDHERVARFIMRCVFTMFAEDVGLLPGEPFRRIIDEAAMEDPAEFVPLAEELWRAMDTGERFLLRKLLRFNGHFFREAEALPLDRKALSFLLRAAEADWQHVEPTIFGTLLTRALDPVKRHRLGAEYTPREFVERVVRPTVEQPIRERWTAVQAEVFQLRDTEKARDKKEAEQRLRDFHAWLRGLRFLDPACGSGNFLYVTMHLVKRIELEVIRAIEEITGTHEIRLDEVGPWQFHGIEVDAWPREIAELTLWIGFHQFWKEHHDVQPPEPILRDTGTLELRDAVLEWVEIVHVPERDRPDPTPRITHPVTGKLVPDPEATLSYTEHRGARSAEWPQADFIVGNPPYIGGTRMRDALGDGYVDALRTVYPEMREGADFVMYWWARAAAEVAANRAIRVGLITTNSITQSRNRTVVEAATRGPARVLWAISDHPWTDEEGGAAVRVAMTVIGRDSGVVTAVTVDDRGSVVIEQHAKEMNSDLTVHADVASIAGQPLKANAGMSFLGFLVNGPGFFLKPEELEPLLNQNPEAREVVKPIFNGRDLASRPRGLYVIDFAERTLEEAQQHPVLYNLVVDRVKPQRDANKDRGIRENWWRFHRIRQELRKGLKGLQRFIVTPETARHRYFLFLDADGAPDHSLVCVVSDSASHLGILSSTIHQTWALAAGSRLGVGNDPRYNKSLCFDSYPFPNSRTSTQEQIAAVAERLDWHRKDALARDPKVTMTGMYNVVEKLRSGESLTPGERRVHELSACGVLRDLHDELDALVAEAYGWSWPMDREEILDRLVQLHDERVQEERRGLVRWLRPEYQVPRFGQGIEAVQEVDLELEDMEQGEEREPWPSTAIEQIRALQGVLMKAPVTVEDAAAQFKGARRDLVARHLETLALMGEVQRTPDGSYRVVREAA